MEKQQLIVHAGSHKTGSSAIQRYLFDNWQRMDGVAYLNRGKPNASPWMLQAFKHNIAELPAFRSRQLDAADSADMRKRARSVLAEQAGQSNAPLSILSAEAIGAFNLPELQALRDFVSPFFSQITLHQYFRPIKARMESAFQEKLKHGATTLEDKFPLAYCHTLDLQDSVFGKENVHAYKYDSGCFPQRDVVAHFLDKLGLKAAQGSVSAPVNAGLSLPAIQLLYAYRKFKPVLAKGDRALVRKLTELRGEPLRFNSALYQKLVVLTQEEIERFKERAGFSLAEETDADDDIGIRDEEDLLAIPQRSIEWLHEQLGPRLAVGKTDLQAVASMVSLLAEQQNRRG